MRVVCLGTLLAVVGCSSEGPSGTGGASSSSSAGPSSSSSMGEGGGGAVGGAGGSTVTQPLSDGLSVLWARRLEAYPTPDALAVAADATGAVLLGGRRRSAGAEPDWSAFVTKLSAAGALAWDLDIDRPAPDGSLEDDAFVRDVVVDADGDVYAAGELRGAVQLGSTTLESVDQSIDVFVAKVSSTGAPVWATAIGNDSDSDAVSKAGLSVSSDGNVALIGHAAGDVDVGNGPVPLTWSYLASLAVSGDVVELAEINRMFLGSVEESYLAVAADARGGGRRALSESREDEFGEFHVPRLAHFDAAGALTSEQPLLPAVIHVEYAQAAFGPGARLLCLGLKDYGAPMGIGGGLVAQSTGEFVVGFDGTQPVWIKSLRASPWEHDTLEVGALAATSDGGAIVTGTFRGAVDFGGGLIHSTAPEPAQPAPSDVFVVRIDGQGALSWYATFGGPGPKVATAAAERPDGSVVIVGSAQGALAFDEPGFSPSAEYHGFVVVVGPTP
ncbi:MAG: hypothetical protein WKG00_13450 [Polyangiaceae bacterium]